MLWPPQGNEERRGEKETDRDLTSVPNTHTHRHFNILVPKAYVHTHKYPHAQEITAMEKSSTVNILQTDCFLKQTYTFTHKQPQQQTSTRSVSESVRIVCVTVMFSLTYFSQPAGIYKPVDIINKNSYYTNNRLYTITTKNYWWNYIEFTKLQIFRNYESIILYQILIM